MAPPRGSTKAGRPRNLKVIQGTLNETREREREAERGAQPARTPGVPTCPPYMKKKYEPESWAAFAEVLGERGQKVLTRDDFAAFESLVTIWALRQRVMDEIRELDSVVCEQEKETKSGGAYIERKLDPAVQALNQIDARFSNWCGKFGLSPGDHLRVGAVGPVGTGAPNPDDEFRQH